MAKIGGSAAIYIKCTLAIYAKCTKPLYMKMHTAHIHVLHTHIYGIAQGYIRPGVGCGLLYALGGYGAGAWGGMADPFQDGAGLHDF